MSLRYEKIIAPCTHGNPPACSLACPFSLDIRDVIQRCGQNRIDAAYRMLEEVVLFPDVVAALCPKPCESACLRKEIDTSIRIREVERFICQHAKRRPARS
jgi:NADPH-dependent glutamate synthase beta subunit-like oxidoreductase